MSFRAEGWHHWPAPPAHRDYLRHPHRHQFAVNVSLSVEHDEREVEFHDLIDFCKAEFGDGKDHGPKSCETMARDLLTEILLRYGLDRSCMVSVGEEDEAAASVAYFPPVEGE